MNSDPQSTPAGYSYRVQILVFSLNSAVRLNHTHTISDYLHTLTHKHTHTPFLTTSTHSHTNTHTPPTHHTHKHLHAYTQAHKHTLIPTHAHTDNPHHTHTNTCIADLPPID